MSESNPPNGLTDAERDRLTERLTNLLTMIERLNAEAKLIIAQLAEDEAHRRSQPGRVFPFPPAPGDPEPGDFRPRPSGWTGDDGPTDQGSL